MRKKHHIEIMMGNDGSTTCYVASDPVTANTSTAGGVPLSPQQASHSVDSVVNILPLSELISTVSQVGEAGPVCLLAFDAMFLCLDLISAVSQVSGAALVCLKAFDAVFLCL